MVQVVLMDLPFKDCDQKDAKHFVYVELPVTKTRGTVQFIADLLRPDWYEVEFCLAQQFFIS